MLNDKVTAIELMPGQFYLDFFHSLKWNVVSALFKDFHPGYFPRSFVGLVNDSSAQLQGDSVIWINLCNHITFNIIMIRFSSRYPEMLKNFEPRQRRNLLNGNVSVFVCAELHKKDPQERMTRLNWTDSTVESNQNESCLSWPHPPPGITPWGLLRLAKLVS